MFGKFEVVFDLAYLAIALGFSLYYLFLSTSAYALLFGIMTLILVVGDAFHLVPRVLSILENDFRKYHAGLERGKAVTAVGMTIFYLILWHIGLTTSGLPNTEVLTGMLYVLAAARIILVLTSSRQKTGGTSNKENMQRNIPFFGIGVLVCGLYYSTASANGLPAMWIAVLLSFVFYIPVVCLSGKYPQIGVLMLPKSCMYLWIISMGLFI